MKKAIISTHKDANFNSNEEKIVRAADLSGLSEDYPEFIKNTNLLKKEYELLNNKKTSFEEWKKLSKKLIEFYLGQNKKTRENLDRFLKESG